MALLIRRLPKTELLLPMRRLGDALPSRAFAASSLLWARGVIDTISRLLYGFIWSSGSLPWKSSPSSLAFSPVTHLRFALQTTALALHTSVMRAPYQSQMRWLPIRVGFRVHFNAKTPGSKCPPQFLNSKACHKREEFRVKLVKILQLYQGIMRDLSSICGAGGRGFKKNLS